MRLSSKLLSLAQNSTLLALLFSEQNMLHRQSLWRFLAGNFLCQDELHRLHYFNFFCLFALNNLIYFSLGYYFTKFIRSFYYHLGFFSKKLRILFLHLENFRQGVPKESFPVDFFCYSREPFTLPFIIPFKYYFLRLDLYSFFFLWAGAEGIRIAFYNSYIQSHPDLFTRPLLRHCFLQSWFPRRKAYVALRGLSLLHLPPFDKTSLRQRLSERFSIMLFHQKYIILNLLQCKTWRFRTVPLPLPMDFCIRKDATLYWLFSLSRAEFAISGLLSPWDWARICQLFFLYFMRFPKRYNLDRWLITRYFKYFTRSLIISYFTAEGFVLRSFRVYSRHFAQRFYRQFFFSSYLQNAFLLQDLYHYQTFSWETFLSFIDRHFCYRVLSMKFNWFFDTYFLKTHGSYLNVNITFNFIRPMKRKTALQPRLPRRRAIFFAKRFLLRFCPLPLFFSYTLLGLEYFYWRIYEYASSRRWLDHRLPLIYYYLKLNIDRLMLSRYYTLVGVLKDSTLLSLRPIYEDWGSSYIRSNKPIFHSERWSLPVHFYPFNPWVLFHFAALKSILLQSLNNNLFLSLIAFYLFKNSSFSFLRKSFAEDFFFRSLASLENAKNFSNYFLVDRDAFLSFKVQWEAPRAAKWLADFDLKKPSSLIPESRYGASYQWLRENKSKWMDY